MDPWFDTSTAGMIGGLGGAAVGILFGAVGGTLAGMLTPRGKCKRFVVGYYVGWGLIGVLSLITCLVAVFTDQPYHVYSPFLMLGIILSVLGFALTPVLLMGYRMAEHRRMDAEQLRAT